MRASHHPLLAGAKTPAERVKDAGLWPLLQRLCAEHHVLPEVVLSSVRTKTVAECRAHFLLVMQDTCGFSLPEMGRMIGRDHTSALYAIRKARARLEAEHAA